MQTNPSAGFIGDHAAKCANVVAHLDGEITVNGHSTHHVQYGIAKEHQNGAGCMLVCGKCAAKYEKRNDCVITEAK